jgi:DNA-directed RNA polymerase subunit RPC12/RpoP
MRTRGELSMGKRPTFLAGFFAVGFLLIISSAGVADAAWTGEVYVSPESAYQGVPFTCSIEFYYTGGQELIIKSVVFTIKWPYPSSGPDWPDPTEHHVIFQGNQTLEPGSSHTFEKKITSDLYGSFSTEIRIVARGEWEANDSEQTFTGNIVLRGSEEAPGYIDPTIILPIVVVLVLIAFFVFVYGPWGYKDVALNLNDTEVAWFRKNLHRLARLRDDELIARYWFARFREMTSTSQGPYDLKRSGILVATDQRLLFFSKTTSAEAFRSSFGIPTATSETICKWSDIELEEIRSYQVSVGSRGTANLTVFFWSRGMVENVEYWYLHDLDTNTLQVKGKTASEELRRTMESMINTRLTKLKEESTYAEKKRLVDFSTLRDKMEKEGVAMETFRCPSCGGDISIPPSGMSVKCQYCGSTIFVRELMEE